MRQTEVHWNEEAGRLLKAELARHGVSYKTLVTRLETMGVKVNEAAVANRLARGTFSFVFFLQCMRALGVETVHLGPMTPTRKGHE